LGEAYKALVGTGHIRRRQRRSVMVAVGASFWTADVPFWREFLAMVERGEWGGVQQWQLLPAPTAMRLAVHRATTDASTSWGAGGVWGGERFGLHWTKEELAAGLHISWLELYAILLALRKWGPQWACSTVLVETDNTAAMSYINKGGGKVPLGYEMMKEVALLCMRFGIALRAVHIAGVDNGEADGASRGTLGDATDDYMFRRFQAYNVPPHTFDAACDLDGLNCQPGCTDWCSAGRDSFLTNWSRAAGQRIWINPPFSLILEFMLAAEQAWARDERTSVTLVVPAWTQQRWYRRARCRRFPLWRELDRIPGDQPLYYRGESERLRAGGSGAPTVAPGPGWDSLVLAFP